MYNLKAGVHINTIEATWGAMKRAIPNRDYTIANIQDKLNEFMWCRRYVNDLWGRLIHIMRILIGQFAN